MKERNRPIRLLLTGGGTGGHLFPAIASAQKLMEKNPGSEVLFVGTRRKMDKVSLEKYGFANASIHCYGLKGKRLFEIIKALLVLPISCFQSLLLLLRFKPDVVLGVGGYVTGPVVATAKMLRIPTVIHEQNSVPGLANRKLAGLVDKICISLPDKSQVFPEQRTVFTGNPVRQEILDKAGNERAENKEMVILVLGGSQGAHGVNLLVSEAVTEYFSDAKYPVRMIHQTGSSDVEMVQKRYQDAGINGEVAAFFQNMADLYEQADLVVSRAGATTLSELAVMGKPAVLIPYPTAADDHQQKNAEYYAGGGGVVIQVEKETDGKALASVLVALINDPQRRKDMGSKIRALGVPDAAEKIIEACLSTCTHV